MQLLKNDQPRRKKIYKKKKEKKEVTEYLSINIETKYITVIHVLWFPVPHNIWYPRKKL